jgi:hypothetical protein
MWKKNAHYYPTRVMWWCRFVKRRIRLLFSRAGVERRRERENMENFYYNVLYDILQDEREDGEKAIALKNLKAKMIYKSMWVDNGTQDRSGEEEPSLHHLIKERKRQVQRTIHMIYDKNGSPQTSSLDILCAFVEHFRTKYDTITASGEYMKRLMDCNMSTIPDTANIALEEPVTMEEIYQAIKTGKPHKAPGYDGICLEFLKKSWETIKEDLLQIVNEMYTGEFITEDQKFGIICCIPKKPHATHVEHYRPLTILNTDYKLLTRIIANRLRPWMQDLLQSSQHCGIMGNSVFDAIATIRDAVAYAEITKIPLCVITIDFQGAFDNLSHEYLFEILHEYGLVNASERV